MKVLLSSNYQWKDALFDVARNVITDVNGVEIHATNIISIEDDVRTNYVRCANCNHIILNTAEAIDAHYNAHSNSSECFQCFYMRCVTGLDAGKTYERNADGTYTQHQNSNCKLYCTRRHGLSIEIDSENARNNCIIHQCRERNSMIPLDDFFIKYPHAFDNVATIDALDQDRWKFNKKSGDYYIFHTTGNANCDAIVNSMGIVDRFISHFNQRKYPFRYSKRYNKLAWIDGYTYETDARMVSDIRSGLLLNEVSKIYKEET